MADEATTAANMRYLALMHRRSAPPRCHPVTILVMVMSSGLLFIGLTMTIIANWPGSTTIGENPLKIAGPILLALGGVGFIIGIVLVSVLNKREQKKFTKSINNLAASRVAMNQSQTSLAGTSRQPQLQGYPSGAGPPPAHSAGYNQADLENGSKNDEKAKLAALNNSYQDYQGKGGGARLTNADDGDSIPQPIRLKKPKKQILTSSSENMTSEEGQELLDKSRQSNDQFPSRGSQSSSSMDVKKRQQATSNQYVDEEELLEAKDKRARTKPATAAKPSGGKPATTTTGVGQPPPSPGEAQRLRVHVKTAPGATVRIHQGPASSLQPQAAYAELHNKSASSQETDF